MSKPLSRRLFGKAMAAAPMMAADVAQAAPALPYSVVPIPPPPFGVSVLMNPALALAKKTGLLPEWANQQIKHEIAERSYRLTPAVAALRSVSLAGKFAIQAQRLERSFESTWEEDMTQRAAQSLFWKQNGNAGYYR